MDVERIQSESPSGGPPSWAAGEHAIRSYASSLIKKNYYGTFFVVPDSVQPFSKVILELSTQGHEFGMHFHPSAWKNYYLKPDLHPPIGAYDAETQKQYLTEGLNQWNSVIPHQRPHVFRGGYYSADNSTFQVLSDIGFIAGSLSLPGRRVPKWHANWIHSRRDVHYASSKNRLKEGTLNFVEVPTTAYINLLGRLATHGDTRIEKLRSVADIHYTEKAILQSLQWQESHHSPIRHLCFLTHNVINYTDTPHPGIKSKYHELLAVINCIEKIAHEKEFEIKGVSIAELREIFIKKTPL
jgi:hypothetical protein